MILLIIIVILPSFYRHYHHFIRELKLKCKQKCIINIININIYRPLPAEQSKPTKRMIGFWEKNLNAPKPAAPQPMKVVQRPASPPKPPPIPEGYRRRRTDQKIPLPQSPPSKS